MSYDVTMAGPHHGVPSMRHWQGFEDGNAVYMCTVNDQNTREFLDVYLSLPSDEGWRPVLGLYYGAPGFGRIRLPYTGSGFRDIVGKCYEVAMKEINENWWQWLNHV